MSSKKLLSLLLCIVMIASQLAVGMSVSAETIAVLPSADESEQDEVVIPDVTPYLAEITTFSHNDNKSAEITTGKCGDDVSYVLYADGSLYIFGSGNMTDYNVGNEEMSPFYELRGSIRRIFVEKGVTSVGNGAFFFILGAEEINLSEGLKKIGSEAFMSCNGVDKIYIPASVTEIGDYALGYKVNNGRYGSFVLNDMRIVGESGSAAADYAADENNSGVDFVERAEKGKCGENAYWVVDNAVGRLTVFGTGAMDDQSYELYSNASTLKSIVVEEGITYLGSRSFCSDYWYWDEGNYDGVEELVLPDSLVGIGDYALQSLNNLKELTLPKNLETIGTKAFGKLKIKKVFIPAKVSNVSDAFSNWSGLEEFEVSPDNESYASVDGLLYQKSEGVLDVLIDIPQATKLKVLKLPKTVTGIANINYNGIEVAEVGEETNIDDGLLYELGSMTQSASLKTLVLRCTSEGYGLYGLKEKTNVYVSFSDAGWKNLVNDPYYDLNWFDLDVYDGRPILTAPQATLNVGESMQLSVCSLDGSEAAYDFIVSTPDVAQTDSDGLLKAVSAGITDITAKAPDGSLSNTITVSVQGTAEAEDEPIKNEPYDFGDYEYKEFPDDPFNCEAYGDYLSHMSPGAAKNAPWTSFSSYDEYLNFLKANGSSAEADMGHLVVENLKKNSPQLFETTAGNAIAGNYEKAFFELMDIGDKFLDTYNNAMMAKTAAEGIKFVAEKGIQGAVQSTLPAALGGITLGTIGLLGAVGAGVAAFVAPQKLEEAGYDVDVYATGPDGKEYDNPLSAPILGSEWHVSTNYDPEAGRKFLDDTIGDVSIKDEEWAKVGVEKRIGIDEEKWHKNIQEKIENGDLVD